MNTNGCKTVIVVLIIWSIPLGLSQKEIDAEDFAKIQLNTLELKGSRWALEQTKRITVYHAFDIVDIAKVDTNDMSIRVEFHVKQRWLAESLEFPAGLFKENDPKGVFLSAEENVLKSVWSPDSFLPNAREAKIQYLAASSSVVNIYANKTIIYKARLYAVLGCSFTFEWYPLDIQICDLIFESHRYTDSVVQYDWEPNPISITNENIILYQYDLRIPPKTLKGSHVRWGGAKYPYVKVEFKFERQLGNNVIQVFTPTILVVILSFFSFWLGLDAVPGRISLLVTCMLSLVTMHGGLKGSIPAVHYVKMMDIWMIGCMVFVFGAICEFVLVKYMKWRSTQKKDAEEERDKYLRDHGLLQMQSTFPMNMRPGPEGGLGYPNGKVPVPNLPNAVYPAPPPHYTNFEHPFISAAVEKRPTPPVRHSAETREAWQQQPFGGPPPEDYPGMINMHQVAIYDHAPIPLPPPASKPTWVKIDRVCRILFPLLFSAFNAAYWPILFKGSARQHEDAQA